MFRIILANCLRIPNKNVRHLAITHNMNSGDIFVSNNIVTYIIIEHIGFAVNRISQDTATLITAIELFFERWVY